MSAMIWRAVARFDLLTSVRRYIRTYQNVVNWQLHAFKCRHATIQPINEYAMSTAIFDCCKGLAPQEQPDRPWLELTSALCKLAQSRQPLPDSLPTSLKIHYQLHFTQKRTANQSKCTVNRLSGVGIEPTTNTWTRTGASECISSTSIVLSYRFRLLYWMLHRQNWGWEALTELL